MAQSPDRVLPTRARHLKWRALDRLEYWLTVVCALLLLGFTLTEFADVLLRDLRHPWLDAQEFSTAFFTWGVFLGSGVAVRRDAHFKLTAVAERFTSWRRTVIEVFNRCVILAVGLALIVFGYFNYLQGYHIFMIPSLKPMAYLYAAIPVCGALVSLFTLEELVNGLWRGFEPPPLSPIEQAELAEATEMAIGPPVG
jgi:TRAP-type C4-dicarboxylate transport system permease small subunit